MSFIIPPPTTTKKKKKEIQIKTFWFSGSICNFTQEKDREYKSETAGECKVLALNKGNNMHALRKQVTGQS